MTQYETTEAQENGICGKENGGGRGIDGFWLKMLAVVTMLIDHIGAIFFPGVLWIRAIGRLSFPIYAFLLTEGFHHTRSTDSRATSTSFHCFILSSSVFVNLYQRMSA